ncbi:MAG: TPM domain-containing protein, partial [Thermoanaerobaculum sp.]
MSVRRLFVLTALVFATVSAAALEVPYLTGRVNDFVGLLDEETRTRLDQKLESLEHATGAQMAVLIIPSLEGESLEDFSHR